MKYIAIIEGQEIPLDEAIAQDDNTLKTAISEKVTRSLKHQPAATSKYPVL